MKLSQQINYSLPAFILASLGVAYYVFLPRYYTDNLGLDISLLGIIILASRLWDALVDPAIGWLSDRTQSRFGRRRPWIFVSSIPLGLTTYLLFSPPAILQGAYIHYCFAFLTFLFFLSWSTLIVPYETWGAELSDDYDARTKLFSIRQGFFIVGTIAAAGLPTYLYQRYGASAHHEVFHTLGVIFSISVILFCFAAVIGTPERTLENRPLQAGIFTATRQALRNRAFKILLIAYIISGFGSALPATLIEFYVPNVLGTQSSAPYLLLYFIVGLLTLPLWDPLTRIWDKKKAWIWALLINSGAMLGIFFLERGDTALYAILVTLSGIGYGGALAIPLSMQADVIEDERLRGGLRVEGSYMGIWSIGNKLSAALGSFIAFPILGLTGYVRGAVQNEQTLWWLSFLYAGLPALCYLSSIFLIVRYPISRSSRNQLSVKLQK